MTAQPITIEVYRALDIIASEGVTKGEPISFADEIVMDDVFQRANDTQMRTLTLATGGDGLQSADGAQNTVHIDCCLTFMGPDGATQEALILVEVSGNTVAEIFVFPLGEFGAHVDYRLVGVARHTATKRFAEAASGAFARGTHITLGTGEMRTIESLQAGDLVLTRDAGKQPVKWIGQTTLRAAGSFAPVVIAKGAMNNENDLVVRPDHRLFVYQRRDQLGAGRSEILIKARHLVDQSTVTRRRGGFVDYYQLVFDEHHIIFAEGIAAESHLVAPHTRDALPRDIAATLQKHSGHQDYEVKGNLIPAKQAAKLLRKASGG